MFFDFLGKEVTYRGHAGLGRPVPSPFLLGPPPSQYVRDEEQILPRKVRGTPTLYADLLFPSSSNFGSMKRRPVGRRDPAAGGQKEADMGNVILRSREAASQLSATNRERETDYVRIRFNPNLAERVELWRHCSDLSGVIISHYSRTKTIVADIGWLFVKWWRPKSL
jgi:hypothetical protein